MKHFFLLFILLLFSPLINAKPEIIWLTDDRRDLKYLLKDEQISIGFDTNNLVLNKVTNFKLDIQYATLARIKKQLSLNKNYCVGNRIKTTERLKHNLFSQPVNIHPNLKLYYLKDNLTIPPSAINEKGQLISLNALFNALPNKILGFAQNRSFGQFIDQQLSTIPSTNIAIRAGEDRYNVISRLFFTHHLDFVIDFPTEIKAKVSQYKQQNNIASLEIAATDNYMIGYIACNKSELGEKFISQVNHILNKLYQEPDYYNAHIRYLTKDDERAFAAFFTQTFR